MNVKAWGAILLCLLLGSLSAGAVTAQSDDCDTFTTPIEYGDTLKGEVTDDTVYVFYCFQGERGDELVIDVEATDGDLDPYLILSDEKIEEIYGENDNISSRDENSRVEYTLEKDALYIITITRADGEDGRTEGEFSLRLENNAQSSTQSSSGDAGQCPDGSNILIPGFSISSTIDNDTYLRSYCFFGTKDTDYRMTAEALNSDLDAAVYVATADLETIIDQNDDATSRTSDARLDFTPDADGVYLVIVSRSGLADGKTEGEYLVSLENRTTGDPDICPDELSFPRRGVELARMDDIYFHAYCFNGSEDERVTFTAEAQRGDLDLLVFITEPDLDTIEQSESKDETMELTAKIPADGPYLVLMIDNTGLGLINMTLEGGGSSSGGSSNDDNNDDTSLNGPGTNNDSGDCDTEPLSFLVNGNWTSTSNTSTTQMDFACDGSVNVTVNGNSFDTTYTFENDTLTLGLEDGELTVEGVLLTRTALIGTTDGQAFMMLNRAR